MLLACQAAVISTVTPEEEGAQKATPNWWFEVVPEGEDGTRLDRFLRRLIPGLPQGDVERMLRSGLVRLVGAKAKPSDRLPAGPEVRLPPHLRSGIPQRPALKPKSKNMPHRDKRLVSSRLMNPRAWRSIKPEKPKY